MLYNPYQKYGAAGVFSAVGSRYGSVSSGRTRYRYPTSQTMTKTKRRRKSGSTYSLKDKIRAMETIQHKTIADNQTSVTILQNQFYHHNVSAQVAAGTSNSSRTNETIYLEALKINGNFNSSVGNNEGTKIRIVVGYSDEQENSGTTGFSNTGFVTSNLFLTNTNATYVTNGIVDPKRFTAIYDQMHTINKSVSGDRETVSFRDSIQLKKSFNYSPGTVFGSDRNLYLIVMANNVTGTSGATAIGDIKMSYDLLFRNSK